MSTSPQSLGDATYRRDLGAGLELRWSTAADLERLAALYGDVFREGPEAPPDAHVQTQVGDLMSGRHPLIAPTDFALVEHTASGVTVAAACLMAQTWRYEGIPLPVGRPEIVAVAPEYRDRGLMRAIFALLHARSAARGDLALGITGIYHYFRQFGYEYALDLSGGPDVALSALPALEADAAEPYILRLATVADIPRLMALYERQSADAAVSTGIDAAYWRWQLDGLAAADMERPAVHMIVAAGDAAAHPCGYVVTARLRPLLREDDLEVLALAVEPETSLPVLAPSLLRALGALPPAVPEAPLARLVFSLGRSHPIYALFGPRLAPTLRRRYAWYVRVPNLPGFVRHVAPALERRLATSPAAGYSGALHLDFYRGGLRVVLERGRLVAVEEWRVPPRGEAQAGFPALVFLQLLFGHRSLDALRDAYPDVWTADDTSHAVLEGLFPARPSWVQYLD
jgi:GNAT superfamily N-acetyltransferase